MDAADFRLVILFDWPRRGMTTFQCSGNGAPTNSQMRNQTRNENRTQRAAKARACGKQEEQQIPKMQDANV